MRIVKSSLICVSAILALTLMAGACRDHSQPGLSVQLPTATENQADTIPTVTIMAATMRPSATPQPTAEPTWTVTAVVPLVEAGADSWYTVIPSDHQTTAGNGFGLVTQYPAVLYASAEDAAVGGEKKRTLPGDEVYVSYSASQTINGAKMYEVEAGGWIAGTHLQVVIPSAFQGIMIHDLPTDGFGWLVNDAFSYRSKNGENRSREMGHYYHRYTLFAVQETWADLDGTQWFRIAEDEWVRDVDFSYVAGTVPEGRDAAGGRWIDVNLSEQNLVVYENNTAIYATLVSTGKERGWTGAGTFTIYHTTEKYALLSPDAASVGNYYLEDVPYILFYQGSWAIHGAYWHDAFGRPNSHGCVNLSLADARWLFGWAIAGDWVFLSW